MPHERKALTRTLVEKTSPDPDRDMFLWDSRVPGFGVRIYPSGKRKYVFQYRTPANQQRRKVLGVHGPLLPEQAREMAADLYEMVRKGGDPINDQRAAASRGRDTIEEVVEQFLQKHLKQKQRAPSYVAGTRGLLNNHVIPRWRGRGIRSITRRDVIELLDAIVEDGKPIAANRVLAAVRKLFNWALQRGLVDASPVTLVERPGEEHRRERVLSAEEIQAAWPHFPSVGYPFAQFFAMILATGQRREEVAHMRWQDIDEAERTWTLGSDMTKAGRAHVVPLSPLAMDILAEAKRELTSLMAKKSADTTEEPELGPYVFTTTGDRPISGYSKVKSRLDGAVAEARAKEGKKPLEPWTIHDLRRTVATGLGRLGVSRFIIARVLNHADRSVTGIYDKYEYLNEKRHALEQWGQYVSNLIAPTDANVVVMRGAA